MDNRVGIDYWSGGWDGQKRAKGENWNNCNNRPIKNGLKEELIQPNTRKTN